MRVSRPRCRPAATFEASSTSADDQSPRSSSSAASRSSPSSSSSSSMSLASASPAIRLPYYCELALSHTACVWRGATQKLMPVLAPSCSSARPSTSTASSYPSSRKCSRLVRDQPSQPGPTLMRSRERVATILSAEPVRQMAPYASEGSSTYVTSSESRLKSRRRGRKRLALFGRHSAPTEAFRLGSRDRANDRARELATEEVGLSPISLLYNSVPGQQSVSLGRTVSTDGPKTPGPYSSVEYKSERLQLETLGADVSEKECSAGVGNSGEKGKEAGPDDEDDEQGSLYDFCDMLRGGPPDSARRRG